MSSRPRGGLIRSRSPRPRRAPRAVRADDPWRRVWLGLGLLGVITVVGTVGYTLLGLDAVDALYMTVFTVSTVGFREIGDSDTAYKLFTIVLILVGVGTALYTLTVLFETIVEGRVTDRIWRRRMDRTIAGLDAHVVVCGFGRLGRTIAEYVRAAGRDVVVVDRDPDRLAGTPYLHVVGNATDDDVLTAAGIERAGTLIAATDDDADNLYLTLGVRTRRPDIFIVARAKLETAEPKLLQAGANRVVNPQLIGGARIAALTLQPHVAEFLDVVMHDGSLEFRLEEVTVHADSTLVGRSLRDAHVRDQTGAMVLAIRAPDGGFVTNPPPDARITAESTLIAIGTADQVARLAGVAAVPATG